MKPNNLRAMSTAHLDEVLTELHTEWRHLRFQDAVGKLTATARIREIRKTIARVHTIKRERELDQALRQ